MMRAGWARLPRGEGPWPWLAAGSVALSLLMFSGLVLLLAVRGLGHFWPAPLSLVALEDGRLLAGQAVREERRADGAGRERLYLTANRDLDGAIWTWVDLEEIAWRCRRRRSRVGARRPCGRATTPRNGSA